MTSEHTAKLIQTKIEDNNLKIWISFLKKDKHKVREYIMVKNKDNFIFEDEKFKNYKFNEYRDKIFSILCASFFIGDQKDVDDVCDINIFGDKNANTVCIHLISKIQVEVMFECVEPIENIEAESIKEIIPIQPINQSEIIGSKSGFLYFEVDHRKTKKHLINIPDQKNELTWIIFQYVESGIDSYGIYYSDIVFDKNITMIGLKAITQSNDLCFIGDSEQPNINQLNVVDSYVKPIFIKKDNVLRIITLNKDNVFKIVYY